MVKRTRLLVHPLSLVYSGIMDQSESNNIVVVIPAYNEADHIGAVLKSVPAYVRTIIVVDDASTDSTARIAADLAEQDPRIVLEQRPHNRGVGAAMVAGFQRALELDAQIVVKVDGDGQMPMAKLPELIEPLIRGEADYAKGNRFRDFRALRQMPVLRRIGNVVLSFMTKAAVGYWNLFDPCNGFVAIRGDVLAQLPLHSIERSFFFEISMLAQLYLLGAVVRDVPMPARYGEEKTSLVIPRVVVEFPIRLVGCFFRRLALKLFVSTRAVWTVIFVFLFFHFIVVFLFFRLMSV